MYEKRISARASTSRDVVITIFFNLLMMVFVVHPSASHHLVFNTTNQFTCYSVKCLLTVLCKKHYTNKIEPESSVKLSTE
uniref:Uncharacterized protein n=1 Tax=Anguilla anguilla TaxID=7936 RepID=A0A0E9WQ18_ANGAN